MQDGGWAILADLSNTTDAQVRGLRGCVLVCVCVCVFVYACVCVCVCLCVLFTVVLPHGEHSGDDCLWPPAWTDIPSELLLNCHHLSFPKEWPAIAKMSPPSSQFYFLFLVMKFQAHLRHTHAHTHNEARTRTHESTEADTMLARGGERRGSPSTHKWTFQLDKQQPALSTSRGQRGY